MAGGCVFCGIVGGSVRCWKVYEDDNAVAFLDRSAVTPGHALVVPRVHASDIWDIEQSVAGRLMECVHQVALLLKNALDPDGLTLFQANRTAGWQDVFHMHVHVVPRYDGDRLVKPWDVPPTDEIHLDEVLRRITADDSTSPGEQDK